MRFRATVLALALALALASTAAACSTTARTPTATTPGTITTTAEPAAASTTATSGSTTMATDEIPTTTAPVLDFDAVAWAHRVDRALEPTDCPDPPDETIPDGWYEGRLFDTHLHLPQLPTTPPGAEPGERDLPGFAESRYRDWTFEVDDDPISSQIPVAGRHLTMGELACTLANEGTTAAFAFFAVFADEQGPMLELARRTMAAHPDAFVPFIMPPGRDDAWPTVPADELRRMLDVHPGLFAGYGEIGLYGNDRRTDEDFPPDGAVLDEVYGVVGPLGLMVYLHPGDGQADNLAAALEAHPEVTFIVHGDQVQWQIGDLMDRYPNVYYTVDALYGDQYLLRPEETIGTFLARTADFEPLLERDLGDWKDVIEAHPDRFLWGTDRGGNTAWSYDPAVSRRLVDYARAFIGRLAPEVQDLFAHANAERLVDRVGHPDRPPATTVPTTAAPTTAAPTTAAPTTAAPTTTLPDQLAIQCAFDAVDRHLSCSATGGGGGSSRWTSSLRSGWSGSSGYELDLRWGESDTSADVHLERCGDGTCEEATTTVDLTREPAGDCPADFTGWFTTFPLPDLAAIHEVGPPFRIVPDGYKGHGYFRVPRFENHAEIRMPTAGTLFGGSAYIEGGEVQYLLSFRTACEGLWFRFDHVREPVAAIVELFTWEPGEGSNTSPIGPLELAEGDLVGTSFGTLGDGNAFLDFGVYDEFARLPVPEHPAAGGLRAVCMYDFFAAEIAAHLRANEHPDAVVEEGRCP